MLAFRAERHIAGVCYVSMDIPAMSEFLPGVRNRSLACLSSAGVACLFAGSAQAAVQTVAVNITLTADSDGQVFALRMTGAGAVSHVTLASSSALTNLANLTATDAVLGIIALYRTWMPDFAVSASGFGGSVVRTSDFARHMSASSSVRSTDWFRSTMKIADSIVASVWSAGGYVGFTLTPEGSGNTYYGWVHIASMAGNASSLVIDGYAWETTPGAAIHVTSSGGGSSNGGGSPTGGTPEPATAGLALLALGAAGVMRHKQRRQKPAA